METINETFSDCQLLFTFGRFFLTSVLQRPVTEDTIRRCTSERMRSDLRVRLECVFTRVKGCGYVVLNFLESMIWLLNCDSYCSLSDEKFSEAVSEMDAALKRTRNLTEDEKNELRRYFKCFTFATEERPEDPLRYDKYDRFDWIVETKRGQFAWGPVYWAFLHRCAFRLEDKMMAPLKADELDKIYNCFTTLMWFVAFMEEFLPCSQCAHRYRYEASTKSTLYTALETNFPRNADQEEMRLSFEQRPLTSAFYRAHREHSLAIGERRHEGYTLDTLLRQLERVERQ